jgi:HAD superfamily hydrolase (TIGR01509 family)
LTDRVLLLDVMGTLVHDPFYEVMPAFLGMTFDELLAVKHPTAWRDFELGCIDEPTLFARFFRDGRAFDGAGLKRATVRAYRFLAGIEELLGDLRGAGVEMHALSNYSEWWREIEARLGLSRYLAWSFVSCDTGVRKPDPEAYLLPARTLGRAPAECSFVDDREQNVAAARAVGMDGVHFAGARGLRLALRARGFLAH